MPGAWATIEIQTAAVKARAAMLNEMAFMGDVLGSFLAVTMRKIRIRSSEA